MAEAVGFYDSVRKLILAIRAALIQVVIVLHDRWQEAGDRGGSILTQPKFERTRATVSPQLEQREMEKTMKVGHIPIYLG